MNKTLSAAELREALLLDPAITYLNAGTFGPNRRDVFDAEIAGRRAMNEQFGPYFVEHFIQPGEGVFRLMDELGAFLGAPAETLALTSGATESLSLVAAGLELQAGDEVLTTDHEHAAGLYPWLMRRDRDGITVREVSLPRPLTSVDQVLEAFAQAVGDRTRVLAFSHVQYTDGAILPVKALCDWAKERDIITVVDGAQAVGMLDFEISTLGCDCYASSLHKWLGGPYGTGVLYLSPDIMGRVWPTVVEDHAGWNETNRFGQAFPKGSSDFQAAWPAALSKYSTNLHYYGPTFFALLEALRLHRGLGQAEIQWRAKALAEEARARLSLLPGCSIMTPSDDRMCGGIVSFRLDGVDAGKLTKKLSVEERISIRDIRHAAAGFEFNRICTHIFNTTQDIGRLVDGVQRWRDHL